MKSFLRVIMLLGAMIWIAQTCQEHPPSLERLPGTLVALAILLVRSTLKP